MFGNSLGVTSATVKNYIDLFESTFMVLVLRPYLSNTGKRLVKAPKAYVADSGITAALLQISSFEQLAGHPVWGNIWEQVVLSNIKAHFPKGEYYFYRTSNGAEMDVVMKYKQKVFAIECKASVAPKLTRGNFNAIEDIKPDKTFLAAPVKEGWKMTKGIDVVSLSELIQNIEINS
jgi:hypothetical protein